MAIVERFHCYQMGHSIFPLTHGKKQVFIIYVGQELSDFLPITEKNEKSKCLLGLLLCVCMFNVCSDTKCCV